MENLCSLLCISRNFSVLDEFIKIKLFEFLNNFPSSYENNTAP